MAIVAIGTNKNASGYHFRGCRRANRSNPAPTLSGQAISCNSAGTVAKRKSLSSAIMTTRESAVDIPSEAKWFKNLVD